MTVAIHSVDGLNYPNLALMRISAWHKAQGDTVQWYAPLASYGRIYASKIFTFTPEDPYLPPDAIRGGTGYDVAGRLPPDVESMPPDYSIYPQFDAAYGFLTRGCVNDCPWCVVPRKEGKLSVIGDIERICSTNTGFRHKAILMDNNFLAAPIDFVREQVDKMRRLKIRVDFNQGTDARLYNDETARIVARIPFSDMCAWRATRTQCFRIAYAQSASCARTDTPGKCSSICLRRMTAWNLQFTESAPWMPQTEGSCRLSCRIAHCLTIAYCRHMK